MLLVELARMAQGTASRYESEISSVALRPNAEHDLFILEDSRYDTIRYLFTATGFTPGASGLHTCTQKSRTVI